MDKELRDYISEAHKLEQKGQIDEAFALLDEAENFFGINTVILSTRGKFHRWHNQYEQANECINSILDLEPENTYVLVQRAKLLFTADKRKQAQQMLDRILELEPDNIHALLEKANIAFKTGNFNKALELYQKIVDLDPNNVAAVNGVGKSYMRLKQYRKAKEYLEKAIEIKPKDIHSLTSLAQMNMELGYFHDAKNYLTRALEISPQDQFALHKMGKLHLRWKMFAEAIKCYDEILIRNENHIPALQGKIQAFFEDGKIDQAIECCDKVLELRNTDNIAASYKAKCMLVTGNFAECQVLSFAVLDREPYNLNAILMIAESYLGQNNAAAAISQLQKVVEFSGRGRKLMEWAQKMQRQKTPAL
jgi:tetratricopeptide (TPR) repeat protein